MIRGRAWLWVLGTIGVVALGYALVMQTVHSTAGPPGHGLVWPLLGVTPLLGIGLWFTAFSDNREGAYLVVAGSGGAVGSAFETYVEVYPQIAFSPHFALINTLGVLSTVSTVGWTSAVATFPGGRLEQPWQQRTLAVSWLVALMLPATLFVSPTVYTSGWTDLPDDIPNPYAIPALEWAAPLCDYLVLAPAAGLVIFLSRALFGDPRTRSQLRALLITIGAAAVGYGSWGLAVVLDVPESTPLAFFVSLAVYASLVAIPLVFIHGVFTYGAFGVRSSARAAAALRSSSLLIGLLYVFAVAAPALLLGHQLTLTEGVVLTVAMAVALQPLRSRVTRFVRGRVMSDPDVQLAVLARLGARLEHTVDLHRTLDELAEAIRGGLRASWARITPAGEDAWASPELTGQAGTVDGPARESRDLLRGGVPVGRIEVGPRRTGEYAPRELELLTTVAGQAATAVANVALAAQLEQRLAELSASRARLVAAQDDERRRIERDLHDGIQQNVVALIAGLRLARNRLERGALDPDELASLQEQARETLSDLREIAHGIAPPVLGDSGLVAAVESRVARFPIPLEVIADPATRQARLDPALEAAAYYVVQESLTNVAKHASARRARVTIGLDASALLVEIQDDGHGFDADRPGFPGGLTNIRDRIEAAGGRLTVRSGGSGTVVSSSFPLTTPSPPAAARSPEPIASVSAHG